MANNNSKPFEDFPDDAKESHYDLYRELAQHVFPDEPVWEEFLTVAGAHLSPAQIKRFEKKGHDNFMKICKELQSTGKIGINKYDLLDRIFEKLKIEEPRRVIAARKNKIDGMLKQRKTSSSSIGDPGTGNGDGDGTTENQGRKRKHEPETTVTNKSKQTIPDKKKPLSDWNRNKSSKTSTDSADIVKRSYARDGKKGYLLILDFHGEERLGNDLDAKNLEEFFEETLAFDVERQSNLELDELKSCLEMVQTELNSSGQENYYCFVCAIMSHGDKDGILTQDNNHITVDAIKGYFDNTNMNFAGLPRVFLVQACRGPSGEPGIDIADDWPKDISDVTGKITVPVESDFLIAFATTPGNKAFRREGQGSWFISSLLNVLKERYNGEHLEEMLIDVRAEVAENFQTIQGVKQMPCAWSTLRKRLYLCNK